MKFKKVDELKEKLKNLRPLNEAELRRIKEQFIIENTYNSNAIEGNSLTLRETAMILEAGITIAEKPLKDHLEAIGHKDAFDYIYALVDKGAVLDEEEIKNIHSLVLMNDAANKGKYRELPVTILGSKHLPPQPYLVPKKMEALLADYAKWSKDKHILEVVARFHLEFEAIHPFIDGNGRVGRLLINFELIKAGLLPINIKFKDRMNYYDCFDHFAETGEATQLLNLIMAYQIEELEKYIDMIGGI